MSEFRVDFDALEWQPGREGVRYKVQRAGSRQVRLIEFLTSEVADYPCEEGHVGWVMAGALDIEIGGQVVSFREGDGIIIPPGPTTCHQATKIVPGTRLMFVEDATG